MASPTQYAVLQKDGIQPNAEQIRRAFSSFHNLTDADAIRLAASAQGILMRQLGSDAARAFQRALQAEGVSAALVPESELSILPDGKSLHRLELNSDGFVIFDLLGHAHPLPWSDLTLVAAGAVRNIETSRDQAAQRTGSTFGVHPNAMAAGTKLDAGSQLLLELVLTGRQIRYEINAAQFPFKYAIDRPDYSTLEKFVWLVKEICRQSPHVLMNRGARDICDGTDLVRGYDSRQLFTDEMVWLLWHHANSKQTGRS